MIKRENDFSAAHMLQFTTGSTHPRLHTNNAPFLWGGHLPQVLYYKIISTSSCNIPVSHSSTPYGILGETVALLSLSCETFTYRVRGAFCQTLRVCYLSLLCSLCVCPSTNHPVTSLTQPCVKFLRSRRPALWGEEQECGRADLQPRFQLRTQTTTEQRAQFPETWPELLPPS